MAFRLRYALRLRLGVMKRRAPLRAWEQVEVDAFLPEWLCAPEFPAAGRGWGNRCVTEADGVALGEFVFFSHHLKHLGMPPDWHKNAFTGQTAPRGRHWSELGDFDFGDIKAIWEPSRLAWAFTLARAHARTREARMAELFWKLLEDWCAQNPPNAGVNWKCGQESAFRLFGATFALAEFGRLPTATPARRQLWSRFVLATGRRIAANLDYALSQSNNHGVSECSGLLTASFLLAPTEETRVWRERGWRHLREQLADLVYADGGFSQHSLVYHRVLLHDLYWMISLCRRAGETPPDWLENQARKALAFLSAMVDPQSGGAPLYGANDGARVLPLEEGAFDDFRGTVQAGEVLLNNRRVYPPGPWDEAAFWLTGQSPDYLPLCKEAMPERWHVPNAGCCQWTSGEARLFLRCPTHFRHRPGQADMLHADVWWRGRAMAHDAGSYSNNAPPPLGNAFGQAAMHNVAMLADREPLEKASRFLYLPWPEGAAEISPDGRSFCASHDGYKKSAQIEREISTPQAGVFFITDSVILQNPGQVRLHWLLADLPWQLDEAAGAVSVNIEGGVYAVSWKSPVPAVSASLVRADPASARGWWSRHYLAVEPAVSLELLFDVDKQLTVSTRFQLVA
ncbi:MAG TPA: heparinase II/III family protein [Opitutales bacterium]|nr:heparinase II/III family protein [Opitutales bacterium]